MFKNVLLGVAMSSYAAVGLGAKSPSSAQSNERQPVTARGAELMALISAAGDAGLMLTQEEGLELVNNGYAQVDTSVADGNTAKVTLTEAGQAALGASDNSGGSNFEIEDNVPIPQNSVRRGRTGGYPFEQLQVNQSFHVPAKADEEPSAVAARLQSSVSGARARFAEETGEQETYTVKTYKRNPDGSFVKDENGKRVVESETEGTRPKMRATRDFTVKAVDASDPKGPGARVWRTA